MTAFHQFLPERPATFKKRFFAALFVLLMILAITFVYLIANDTHDTKRQEEPSGDTIDQTTVRNTIHDIENSNPPDQLIKEAVAIIHKPISNRHPSHLASSEAVLHVFKAGSQSPLSVYHTNHTQQLSQSNKPANNIAPIYKSNNKAQVNQHTLSAGTLIPATLVTGINSDLTGYMIARVRRHVFDTQSGAYLLIPQGTTLFGQYSSTIAYGQSRVLISWSRLIFPNGQSLNLGSMPGTDNQGYAGLSDQVNHHYWRIFGSSLMMSIFSSAGQLSQPQNNSNQLTNQQLIYGAIGQQMSQTAMQLVAKNMNIQPTIQIRPGTNFNVLITKKITLPLIN